jgi:hypothetical protein
MTKQVTDAIPRRTGPEKFDSSGHILAAFDAYDLRAYRRPCFEFFPKSMNDYISEICYILHLFQKLQRSILVRL